MNDFRIITNNFYLEIRIVFIIIGFKTHEFIVYHLVKFITCNFNINYMKYLEI